MEHRAVADSIDTRRRLQRTCYRNESCIGKERVAGKGRRKEKERDCEVQMARPTRQATAWRISAAPNAPFPSSRALISTVFHILPFSLTSSLVYLMLGCWLLQSPLPLVAVPFAPLFVSLCHFATDDTAQMRKAGAGGEKEQGNGRSRRAVV